MGGLMDGWNALRLPLLVNQGRLELVSAPHPPNPPALLPSLWLQDLLASLPEPMALAAVQKVRNTTIKRLRPPPPTRAFRRHYYM